MIIGIVGSEMAKFTSKTRDLAKAKIRELLSQPGVEAVCSGHCHLGGVDIFAEEIADELGLRKEIFPPDALAWPAYRRRNLKIAMTSDQVYCITIKEYPAGYSGMKFAFCYHCGTPDHIKSGGCWTVLQAQALGKPGEVIVIG